MSFLANATYLKFPPLIMLQLPVFNTTKAKLAYLPQSYNEISQTNNSHHDAQSTMNFTYLPQKQKKMWPSYSWIELPLHQTADQNRYEFLKMIINRENQYSAAKRNLIERLSLTLFWQWKAALLKKSCQTLSGLVHPSCVHHTFLQSLSNEYFIPNVQTASLSPSSYRNVNHLVSRLGINLSSFSCFSWHVSSKIKSVRPQNKEFSIKIAVCFSRQLFRLGNSTTQS